MSKRKVKSKRASQLIHAKRRLLERYGMVLTRPLRESLLRDIRGGRACFLGRQSNRVSVWEAELQERKVTVVYDSLRHMLVTFLAPGMSWWTRDIGDGDVLVHGGGSEQHSDRTAD